MLNCLDAKSEKRFFERDLESQIIFLNNQKEESVNKISKDINTKSSHKDSKIQDKKYLIS